MAMSISSSRASMAMLSQPIKPQTPAAAPAPKIESSAAGSKGFNASETLLLALNTEGPLGRHVNQKV